MDSLLRFPLIVIVSSFIVMLLSARVGVRLRNQQQRMDEETRQDFDLIVTAVLTLLALIIGFSFSMAISRYDLRKSYEEAEANAIGTEYVRADLLPAAEASKVRVLLKDYLDQRILFYQARDEHELQRANANTAQLQSGLWSTVQASASAQPTPLTALAVSGVNDVLNSQGYTQAAWWNRIPLGAWILMGAVAISANLLVGYGRRNAKTGIVHLLVLPFVICIAFFLIADIDSPRRGVIFVRPQNLISLAHSLQGH
jgi:protein-S-isoprenylcysteine O-methyltransferase Ste14